MKNRALDGMSRALFDSDLIASRLVHTHSILGSFLPSVFFVEAVRQWGRSERAKIGLA